MHRPLFNKTTSHISIFETLVRIFISELDPPIECPATNPYAFKQGRQCCKTKKEDTGPGQGFSCHYDRSSPFLRAIMTRHPHCDSSCDGGALSVYSNCCEDGAFVDCPDGKLCIDGNVDPSNYIFISIIITIFTIII